MKIPKLFKSKLFLVLGVIVLAGVFTLELKQWRERKQIDDEIAALVKQQQDLERNNQALQQSLNYFASDSYKEMVARKQLGLQKEGETVYSLPGDPQTTPNIPPPVKPETNLQKWWRYIFKNSQT